MCTPSRSFVHACAVRGCAEMVLRSNTPVPARKRRIRRSGNGIQLHGSTKPARQLPYNRQGTWGSIRPGVMLARAKRRCKKDLLSSTRAQFKQSTATLTLLVGSNTIHAGRRGANFNGTGAGVLLPGWRHVVPGAPRAAVSSMRVLLGAARRWFYGKIPPHPQKRRVGPRI